MNLLARLKQGLGRTRTQIAGIVSEKGSLDEAFFDVLEEALLAADVGLEQAESILDRLRDDSAEARVDSTRDAWAILKHTLTRDLTVAKPVDEFPPKPWVILVVGVNGVGKTTTIGKMAQEFHERGKRVMLGAADTFRAGAIEQLGIWAERTGSDFVAQQAGADAASVAFDAMEAARGRGTDVLMLDTAGRLHTKANLMSELQKIVRVVRRHTPHAPNEILLVVDATTGQNALKQAEVFHQSLGLTGLVITKLDGTAKGGMALALTRNLGVPIRKVGVGEGENDLQDFDPATYVEAMFGDLE
ncbi:MAG: signal recognition particle-docking protein FtsY [Chitinivibrionales bacterium]|nr:signal recognition particle-docking protein FtsY [Chitinivibrionales bacterium]MBD3396646.1 signal recognition particle-docking protein FtsY [Chitinivibrionales bacterium]